MGSAVQSMASSVQNGANGALNTVKNMGNNGQTGGQDVGSLLQAGGKINLGSNDPAGNAMGNWITGAGNMLNPNQSAPSAPGVNPSLAQLQQQQIQQAQQFRSNIPTMQNDMTQNLRGSVNQTMGNNIKSTNENNNARGLLYGGVNEGQKQQQVSSAQNSVASGVSNINSGLLSAANQMDSAALGTAAGIQQSQQQVQNDIYSQAMAQASASNSMIGNVASTGLLYAMLA